MASTSDADASDLESIKRKLIKSLPSSWEEVVQIYEQDPRAHKIEIGPSGNTALHIAVSSGREDIVERLVKSIAKNGNPVDVLSIGNRDGNNPLHLGASLGSISMCRCITGECKELLGHHNRESDTPLLRAARYGKKDVFLCLYDMCEGNAAAGYCKNDDGKNVLHLAIEGGHMDLAFQIICKQEDLMDSVDRRGISPLHVLAEKPTAFRSGIHLGWFNKIIYPYRNAIVEMVEKIQLTPILLASRNGIVEMVEKILQLFPMAIHDTSDRDQNIVLVAVEHRQSHIYDFLLNSSRLIDKEGAFHAVDCGGNNALHLAGKLAGDRYLQRIPTSMLQMQWEVKWYQYVQNSLPPHFVVQKNRGRRTPDEIFQIQHQKLEDESKQWLNSASNSCSFIAALIATVAFASSASVPGGVKQDTGEPVFENHLAFSIFAMASLVALCCSVISLLIFLAIFISKHQDKDFTTNLTRNFLVGLTSLFISMAAMLTCFCSGNFLMLKGQLKYAAILVYALTGLLMVYFVLKHFPLFIDLLKATFRKVPERIYKEYLLIALVWAQGGPYAMVMMARSDDDVIFQLFCVFQIYIYDSLFISPCLMYPSIIAVQKTISDPTKNSTSFLNQSLITIRADHHGERDNVFRHFIKHPTCIP
uniref:PGG domain-containing protein n=1 Tax=Vitis vinifera TaxID=29760 RepID=F6HWR6_VITVI